MTTLAIYTLWVRPVWRRPIDQIAGGPAGSFFTLSLSKALLEGALQWDGRYLDIDNFDKGSELIYQVEVSGSNATVVTPRNCS